MEVIRRRFGGRWVVVMAPDLVIGGAHGYRRATDDQMQAVG
jgi:hypothetical protein